MILKIKKIIPYFFALIILIGFFGLVPIKKVNAADSDPGTCITSEGPGGSTQTTRGSCTGTFMANPTAGTPVTPQSIIAGTSTSVATTTDSSVTGSCTLPATASSGAGTTITSDATQCSQLGGTFSTSNTANTGSTALDGYLNQNVCVFNSPVQGTFKGCMLQISYGLFVPIPALILTVCAYFFNFLVSITLYSSMFTNSSFIPTAWAVVRDLSNLFFILILLYIAIQLILDLGGHDAKKMITKVIIIALLINFSMFFTEVVVDSSNILALIFYNKMSVSTNNANRSARPYQSANGEKDVAGGLTASFNPTTLLTPDFFQSAGNVSIPGQPPDPTAATKQVDPWTVMGLLLMSGVLMLFAAYAFFVSGFSFLGRLIELFVLIIFSPFAFMSFTVPKLESVPYIGWDAWLKRLLTVSFMAPIFMFFMYFIFLLVQTNFLSGMITKTTSSGMMVTILTMLIPEMIVLVLLLKAVEFAKKGSGEVGEMVMKGAQLAGGLAVGAATGGTALLATKGIGGYYKNIANDSELRRKAAGGEGVSAKEQKDAQRRLATANSMASKSFDFRQTGIGKFVGKQTGMNINRDFGIKALSTEQLKGGATANDKRATEKEEARIESYKMTKKEAEIQDRLANDGKQPQNIRAGQYEKDKNEAKRLNPNLDEEKFKEKYEKGGTKEEMEEFGIEHGVAEGSVEKIKTSAQVNQERRTAYANSLDKNNEYAKGAMRTFGKEFMKGSGISGWKSGLASAGLAVATGGASLAVQVGAGLARGGVQGSRTALANQMDGTTNTFLKAFKEVVRPSGGRPTSEIIATIRKEDPNKWLKTKLDDIGKGKHVSGEEKEQVAKKIIDSSGSASTGNPPEHH
jgi:hypothetical protein